MVSGYLSLKLDYTAASSLIGVLFKPFTRAFGGSINCVYIRGSFCTSYCSQASGESVLCQAFTVKDNTRTDCFDVVGRLMDLVLKEKSARLAVIKVMRPRTVSTKPLTLVFHVPYKSEVGESLPEIRLTTVKPWPWEIRIKRELSYWVNLTESLEIMKALDRMMNRAGLAEDLLFETYVCKAKQTKSYPIVKLCYNIRGALIDCVEFEVSLGERSRGDIRYKTEKTITDCINLGRFESLSSAMANGVIEVLSMG